jgi:hypothetical protein
MVGIVYLVGDKIFIDSTPLSGAGQYADHLIHDRGHDEYWAQLVKTRAVPRAGYEEFPRGRVTYGNASGKFVLFADACILRENKVLYAILSRLNMPVQDTETGTVSIYRCHRCLGRSR